MARKAKRAAGRGTKKTRKTIATKRAARGTPRKQTGRKPASRKPANHGLIDLYTDTTPNGYKIHIMLEEVGLPYAVHHVDIGTGDQFKPAFLAISPNNKIPAITDRDGPGGKPLSVFESGAILIYLAEKSGRLLPKSGAARHDVMQWLMFQMGGVGPMLGQAHHFRLYAPEQIAYAIDRYTKESNRLYGVMDKRLADRAYLAGDYSIADIACWPWLRRPERQGVDMADYPNVKRWFDAIAARPAVERGLAVLASEVSQAPLDDKAREILFGAAQYKRH